MRLETKVKLFKFYFVLSMLVWQACLLFGAFYFGRLVITLEPNPMDWWSDASLYRAWALALVTWWAIWWCWNWGHLVDFLRRKEDYIRDRLERRAKQ